MNLPSINIQGNILTFDILEEIAVGGAAKQAARDYGFDSKEALRKEIQDAWVEANEMYKAFNHRLSRLPEEDTGTSPTRDLWMGPLFSELGYELMRFRQGQIVNEKNYFISHGANNLGDFPIHIIGANLSLDRKGSGMRMSPHALVQEYLNHHENLYAIVTNGKTLRLLRDSSLLTRLSYVEFDLVKMFEEGLYNDFAVFYRLLHASRMPQSPEEGDSSIIEQYHQDGLAAGSRIRDKLSQAVEEGILKLATGLLKEPENTALREWVKAQNDAPQLYYEHLLKLIYRLLFIMVIEERDLVFPALGEDASKADQERYYRLKRIFYDHYSLGRLRKLAVQYQLANDKHYDLWETLINIFHLFEPGEYGKRLGIAPLAGDLFTANALGPLYRCRLNNKVLLETLRGLSQFENEQQQRISVNYASLDVEEFGSVYEGLLEYAPYIDTHSWKFSFVQGDDRSSSGSHYTPDELVQPLIKHSLEHLIQDRTLPLDSPAEKIQQAVQSLLSLSVCDVACGSGHILLAAARRIGLEVARLRSGEEQPNPAAVRRGVRDAITNCIYGVDKNPLAVELCKVALWLEAHVPGEPLNFLDHKIKNGDAIVGLAHMEELQNGIASEAFKAYTDEEKELCRLLKKSNTAERKSRESGQLFTSAMIDTVGSKLEAYQENFRQFREMPEHTVEEIAAKQKAYKKLTSGANWWFVNNLANLQVAQFFVSKSKRDNVVTDADYFDIMAGRKTQTMAETLALAEATQRKFFHWFLEFPEVFAGAGFDCILGNPPYLGGTKISGAYGKSYYETIKEYYEGASNRCDLVGYFLRRIYSIIKDNGFFSILTTNSIAEGDTREGSLDIILNKNGVINFAIKAKPWVGKAVVTVTLISIFKGEWKRELILDNKRVESINSFLSDDLPLGSPFPLFQNSSLAYNGSYIYGDGFTLPESDAKKIIQFDQKYKEVLFPYLNGSDLNTSPIQYPSRWVINFHDWNLEKAQKYEMCFHKVEKEVKQYRLGKSEDVARAPWWLFWRLRKELYDSITNNKKILIHTRVTKTHGFSFVDPNWVYSDATVVFNLQDFSPFSILQSTVHDVWATKYSSAMKTDRRYSIEDCFQTFPFSQNLTLQNQQTLETLGQTYHESRRQLMLDIQLGLTKTYNQFHNERLEADYSAYLADPEKYNSFVLKKKLHKETYNLYNHLEKTEGAIPIGKAVTRIAQLRQLHREMDEAVLEAYGWHIDTRRWGPAIKLRHDFYEVDYLPENDRVRYTIHPDARKEVLKRLLLLNHEIHEAEERDISYEELEKEKVIALLHSQVEKWLPQANTLEENTLKFLCSGEDLLPNLTHSLVKSYKPFVTQYSSAIENELQHKVFITFNTYFQQQYPNPEEKKKYLLEQMAIDSKMNLLCKNLLKNDVKYTLGNMHFILNLIYKPGGSTITKSSLLQSLRSFTLSVYHENILSKQFLTELDEFIKDFRNEAAHTGDINKQEAINCRDEVRRLMGVLVANKRPSS